MGDGGAGATDAFRLPEDRSQLYHPFANGLILKYGSNPGLLDGTVGVIKSSFHKADNDERSVQVFYFVVTDPGGTTLVAMRAIMKEGMEVPGRLGKALVMDQLECAELFRRQGLGTTLVTFVSDMAQHNEIELFSRCHLTLRQQLWTRRGLRIQCTRLPSKAYGYDEPGLLEVLDKSAVSFWAKRGFEVEGDSQVLGFCHGFAEAGAEETMLMHAGRTFYRYFPGGSNFDSSLQPFYHRAEDTDDDEVPPTTEESSASSSGRESCSGEEVSVRKGYEDDIELTSSTGSDLTSQDEGSPSSPGASPEAGSGVVCARPSVVATLPTAVGDIDGCEGMVIGDPPPPGTVVGRSVGPSPMDNGVPSVATRAGVPSMVGTVGMDRDVACSPMESGVRSVAAGSGVLPGFSGPHAGTQWVGQKPLGTSEKVAIEALASLPSEGSPSVLSFDDVVAKVGGDMDDDSALAMVFAMSLGEDVSPVIDSRSAMPEPVGAPFKGSVAPDVQTSGQGRVYTKQAPERNMEGIGQAPWGAPAASPYSSPSSSPSSPPLASSVKTARSAQVADLTAPAAESSPPICLAAQPAAPREADAVECSRQSSARGNLGCGAPEDDARPAAGARSCLGKRGRGCRGERICSSRKCCRRLRRKKDPGISVRSKRDPAEDCSHSGEGFSVTEEGGVAVAEGEGEPGTVSSPPGSLGDIAADVIEGGSALVSMSRANEAGGRVSGERSAGESGCNSKAVVGSNLCSSEAERVATGVPESRQLPLGGSLVEGWAAKPGAVVVPAAQAIQVHPPVTNDSMMVGMAQPVAPQGAPGVPSAVASAVGHGALGGATPPDFGGDVDPLALPPVPSIPVPLGTSVDAIEFNSAGSFTGDVGVGVGGPGIETDEEKNLAFLREAGVEPEEAKAILSYDATMEADGMGSLGSLLAAASWEGDASSQEAEHMRQALEASRRCHEEEMMKRAKEASREETGRPAGIRIAPHVAADVVREPLSAEPDAPGEQVPLTRKGKLRGREE